MRQVKNRIVRPLGLLVVAGMLLVPGAAFATHYGEQFNLPASIAAGSPIDITLTTGTGAVVSQPQGSSPLCTPSGTPTHCGPYPITGWTSATACFYSVHEIAVKDPNGNVYVLGSAHTSGLYWPPSLGGPKSPPELSPSSSSTKPFPPADALNVTGGDTFTVPFAQGAGGFSFTSVLGNPPNNVSPEGPYYWWTAKPNVHGIGLRLDTTGSSINPTSVPSTPGHPYVVDIEGVDACPSSKVPVSHFLFFDAGITVGTPQFPFAMGLVVATGLGAMLFIRKRFAIPAK